MEHCWEYSDTTNVKETVEDKDGVLKNLFMAKPEGTTVWSAVLQPYRTLSLAYWNSEIYIYQGDKRGMLVLKI